MATLTVRNLPDDAYRALKVRAARHGHSMEAEARRILQEQVETGRDFVGGWLAAAATLRGEELPLPARSAPRDLDLP